MKEGVDECDEGLGHVLTKPVSKRTPTPRPAQQHKGRDGREAEARKQQSPAGLLRHGEDWEGAALLYMQRDWRSDGITNRVMGYRFHWVAEQPGVFSFLPKFGGGKPTFHTSGEVAVQDLQKSAG